MLSRFSSFCTIPTRFFNSPNHIRNYGELIAYITFSLLSLGKTLFFLVTRKRFYKNTNILRNEGKYEVVLDQRKLKTPQGNLFVVDSEPLALAVAAEWDSQKDKILQSSMHLVFIIKVLR